MPTVLITGANRGIGLEFARQYAADGWEVIATARQSSPELEELGVRIEQLDMPTWMRSSRSAAGSTALDLLHRQRRDHGIQSRRTSARRRARLVRQ